jgi:hypothetical protein
MRKTVARLVAVALLVAACSPSESADSTTSSSSTSTSTSSTSTSTTSTTLEAKDTSLINGLEVDDPTLLDRRVMAVKIDNHPRARPQSNLHQADMVIEMLVEGITRMISIWHQSDIDFLGPNRSGRPTDANLLPAFNHPTFTISGGQAWVQNMITGNGVNLIKELSEGTFRISSRSAPHNLYVDTFVLRETADEREYENDPPTGPIWTFGAMPATATPASLVDIAFGRNEVVWEWDQAGGVWLRTVDGRESNSLDEDNNAVQIAFPVLVALYTDQYSENGLPSSDVIGSGRAFVFADGKYVEGTWERDSIEEWFTLLDANGNVMPVPPGKSWFSLVPTNSGLEIGE